ncbi:rhomboid 11, chloroplastic [Olea europaea subsp. europaea]|uniref:Rhomboid 11, chloroplastic n=1 Tax=Olea europaea subsp. europaea TaxID=158383 RepID=A0A8S0SZ32_OLEEU|nr:rhomboid 11, chloroplastic [Olea europaea subsp. europaea]
MPTRSTALQDDWSIHVSDTVQVCKVNPVSFMSHLNAGCAISLEVVCWWSPTNVYGKLVEEGEGNSALWLSYILTGAGANLVSWLILPRNAVSSGAVFGLFAIDVLVKMSWDWRKILEILILGQFVVEKIMEAAQASTNLAGSSRGVYGVQNVNHIAHLSGALVGVVLIRLLSRVLHRWMRHKDST